MSFGWINAEEFSINTLLLMDRWIFRVIAANPNTELMNNLAMVLANNPAVYWYIVNKCLEQKGYYDSLVQNAPNTSSEEQVRKAEIRVLDELDSMVVYVYPELTDERDYVKYWDKERLLELTDFTNKTVLDIGSGTGRLAFTAAPIAKTVYASEPVDRMREYLREKKKRLGLENVYVVDGTIEEIPFQDEFFDIVMSGHVIGDKYEAELKEMMRVTKPGGYIIDCPGEDDRKMPVSQERLDLGFQYLHYESKCGGDVYRYWKQKDE